MKEVIVLCLLRVPDVFQGRRGYSRRVNTMFYCFIEMGKRGVWEGKKGRQVSQRKSVRFGMGGNGKGMNWKREKGGYSRFHRRVSIFVFFCFFPYASLSLSLSKGIYRSTFKASGDKPTTREDNTTTSHIIFNTFTSRGLFKWLERRLDHPQPATSLHTMFRLPSLPSPNFPNNLSVFEAAYLSLSLSLFFFLSLSLSLSLSLFLSGSSYNWVLLYN